MSHRVRWTAANTDRKDPFTVDHRPLPEPAPGEHLWVLMACYRLSHAQARACHQGGHTGIEIGAQQLVVIEGPGCLVCESVYGSGAELRPCPGQPPGELAYVQRPRGHG